MTRYTTAATIAVQVNPAHINTIRCHGRTALITSAQPAAAHTHRSHTPASRPAHR
jgi:hypothetical protein